MNKKIGSRLQQIKALEDELHTALHEQEKQILYRFEGTRIELVSLGRLAKREIPIIDITDTDYPTETRR